jgi:uncharacterized protein YdeI (YjbR/CyaY-like superfamily)
LITETIKWGMPFFDYKGSVCHMAAFKQHCAFGFWQASRLDDPQHLLRKGEEASAGSFGRINSLADLPPNEAIISFVLQAIKLNEVKVKSPVKKATTQKAEIPMPDYFMDVLKDNPAALTAFEKFSPSHRSEYLEWIVDAKSDATRQKRMETAVEWLVEGKSRNWKYQKS